MQRELIRMFRRKHDNKLSPPYIAMTGAQGTGKSTLAEALKPRMEALLGKEVTLIQGIGRQMKAKGFAVDNTATIESKWAIEAEYSNLETKLKQTPKLFCRSIVDRFAYARACGIDMDTYFDKLVVPSVLAYDVLFYIPIETRVPLADDGFRNMDAIYQRKVDNCIREILQQYDLSVQVLTGSVEQRVETALESIKLRLGVNK